MQLERLLQGLGNEADWSHDFGLPFPAVIRFRRLDTLLDEAGLQNLRQYLADYEDAAWLELRDGGVPKRLNEWMLGRIEAKRALRALLARPNRPAPEWRQISLQPDAFGKPVPVIGAGELMAKLSISHTRSGVVVIAADTGHAIGIDLEPLDRIQSDCRAFARHTLTEAEQALVGDGPDCRRRLLDFWVAKEAAAKAVGTGFQGQPKAFELTGLPEHNRCRVVNRGHAIAVELRELAGHRVAVAFCDQ